MTHMARRWEQMNFKAPKTALRLAGRRTSFYVSDDVHKYFRKALSRGKKCEKQWQEDLNTLQAERTGYCRGI